MRIMGLDYGTKTVGVAISDALGLTAQGIETIQRKEENKLRRTLARIEELVREYEVDTIVLGFPKHMNNDVGERAKKSLEFKEMLMRRTGLDVVMWDERLTTVEAERTLIESQVRRENRKQYIDKIAAVYPAGISGFDLFEKESRRGKLEAAHRRKNAWKRLSFVLTSRETALNFLYWNRQRSTGHPIFL